jgi:hypothetical protein
LFGARDGDHGLTVAPAPRDRPSAQVVPFAPRRTGRPVS